MTCDITFWKEIIEWSALAFLGVFAGCLGVLAFYKALTE